MANQNARVEQTTLMTDDGSSDGAAQLDLGAVWYVVAEPKAEPARVVAGPFGDHDSASLRSSLEPGLAGTMLGLHLVNNIRNNGYNVEWTDGVERPNVVVDQSPDTSAKQGAEK